MFAWMKRERSLDVSVFLGRWVYDGWIRER